MSTFIDIATIDISPLSGNNLTSKLYVANQISAACKETGFFYISSHGIDVRKLQKVANKFFGTITQYEKWNLAINAYNKNNSRNHSGYYMAMPGKKAVESFYYLNPNFTVDHPMIKAKNQMHEVNVWPDPEKHPDFRQFCEGYYWNMYHLSLVLLRGFALALGKSENFFDSYFHADDTLCSATLIRYPFLENYPPVKIASDGTKISFGEHQDVSLISIAFQTPIPNAQVEMADGFYDVPTSDENLLVHCGTYMAYITNNYFHAPNHRVKHVNAERLCLPFFVKPSYNTMIRPFTANNREAETNSPPVISCGKHVEDGLHALLVKNGQT